LLIKTNAYMQTIGLYFYYYSLTRMLVHVRVRDCKTDAKVPTCEFWVALWLVGSLLYVCFKTDATKMWG